MLKPSKQELEHALAAAEYLRARNNDAHDIAKSLLYLDERNRYLEKVFEAAELYLRFGQGPTEHARLLRAIETAKAAHKQGARRETV